jgi:microcystin-dependent protein
MIENGAAISRTTYATLFARIGTTFGAGDGSTTFNIPNSVNRTSVGATGLYAVGAKGGNKDAIVVAHTHTITDPGHVHGSVYNSFDDRAGGAGGTPNLNSGGTLSNSASAVTGISINSAGVSATDANMPPYIGKLKIIKVL